MKNKFLLITGLVVIGLLVFIIINNKDNNNYNKGKLKDITYSEYLKKVNNKDTFILYVKQTNCSHCINFTPVLKSILVKYNVTAYSLNLSDMSETDYKELDNELNISGTPTIMFFEEGVELGNFSRISGEKSEEFVVNKLKTRGYIK